MTGDPKTPPYPSPLVGEVDADRREVAGEGVTAPQLEERARQMRTTDTERRLWNALRDRRLAGLKFRRQVPVGNFIADFVCHDVKLIVELDGSQHADSDYDPIRDAWLSARGYDVLRFWNSDVLKNLTGILESIRAAATANTPSSDPLLSERVTFSRQGRRDGEKL